MALPLTVFKTVPVTVGPALDTVYTAPIGYNSIVLTAQVTNTSTTVKNFSMKLIRNSTEYFIVSDYPVAKHEVLVASGGTAGKLVLQTGDSLAIYGDTSDLKFTLSVLETLV